MCFGFFISVWTLATRPLIVDQPDENLDNESIYKLLTSYFKIAKTRRQVILITHNPNLVVNGDSEQVIVASCDRLENGLPHIKYQSGSLETTLQKKALLDSRYAAFWRADPTPFSEESVATHLLHFRGRPETNALLEERKLQHFIGKYVRMDIMLYPTREFLLVSGDAAP